MKEIGSIGIKVAAPIMAPRMAPTIGRVGSFGERSFGKTGMGSRPFMSIDKSLSSRMGKIDRTTPFQFGMSKPAESKPKGFSFQRTPIASVEQKRVSPLQRERAFGRSVSKELRFVRESPKLGIPEKGIIFTQTIPIKKEVGRVIDFASYKKTSEERLPKPINFAEYRMRKQVSNPEREQRKDTIRQEMLSSLKGMFSKEKQVSRLTIIPINQQAAREEYLKLTQLQRKELSVDFNQALKVYRASKQVAAPGISPVSMAIAAFERAVTTRGMSKEVCAVYIEEELKVKEEEKQKEAEMVKKTKGVVEVKAKTKEKEEEEQKKKEKKDIIATYVAQEDKEAQEARLELVTLAVDEIFKERADEILEGAVISGKEIVGRWKDGAEDPSQNSHLLSQVGLDRKATDGSLVRARLGVSSIIARTKEAAMKAIKKQLEKHIPVIIKKVEESKKATPEDIHKVLHARTFMQWFADVALNRTAKAA